MLTPEDIDRLESFNGGDTRVLSAYLDLDPARQVRRSYRIAFEDLVKVAREGLAEPTRADLAREAARVQAWLEGQEPRGKGLALISCSPKGLWQAYFLAVRVREHLAFEPRPDVAPLLELVDEHERYAVALVEKKKARLFSVFLGEIEETEAFEDPLVPTKHDQGGLSQANFQQHHEAHVHRLLARVARRLAELHRRRRFDRLILAGPEEVTTMLRRLLPRQLARLLSAVVPAKLGASDAEVLNATLEVERGIEREAEERLLKELLDLAGPGGRATLGVVPTLDALWADMVQTLVVAHGVHGGGNECLNCGRLELGRVDACSTCGKAMRPVHDVFHRAMARAREQAASVEVVQGAAARRLQEAGEGVGAFLRYRWGGDAG
jgi:hypothetical protein